MKQMRNNETDIDKWIDGFYQMNFHLESLEMISITNIIISMKENEIIVRGGG